MTELLIVLALGIPTELYLIKINYEARVKLKEYFVEGNEVWRWFDNKGGKIAKLGFLLHFLGVITMLTILSIFDVFVAASFVAFMVVMAQLDYSTLNSRKKCIAKQCPVLEKCIICRQNDETGLFTEIKNIFMEVGVDGVAWIFVGFIIGCVIWLIYTFLFLNENVS